EDGIRDRTVTEVQTCALPISTVYEKGAEIVRMLATLLGEAGFRKGMDLYFERHDGEATTIEAFLKVFEDANGVDLSHFGKWYLRSEERRVGKEWGASGGRGEG